MITVYVMVALLFGGAHGGFTIDNIASKKECDDRSIEIMRNSDGAVTARCYKIEKAK